MKITKTKFNDAWLIEPNVHKDSRGFFLESYTLKEFTAAGISTAFIQDNHSMSVASGVLRGMHFQKSPFAQSKLVRVIHGAIFDVIVDLRRSSPTFGQWDGFELTNDNYAMLFVPKGFAHGFCTLAPRTEVIYKVDDYYSPSHDGGFRWNDPDIGIKWPVEIPVLSEKDSRLPFLKDITASL